MSSAAAPAVRGPGGHRGTEQGRPGAAGTGPLPSSTRVNSGVAGARCPAQGRRGLEGSMNMDVCPSESGLSSVPGGDSELAYISYIDPDVTLQG